MSALTCAVSKPESRTVAVRKAASAPPIDGCQIVPFLSEQCWSRNGFSRQLCWHEFAHILTPPRLVRVMMKTILDSRIVLSSLGIGITRHNKLLIDRIYLLLHSKQKEDDSFISALSKCLQKCLPHRQKHRAAEDSHVVPHRSTNLPVRGLTMPERTG